MQGFLSAKPGPVVRPGEVVFAAREAMGDHVYLVDGRGAQHLCVTGLVGFPFFGELIRDCLERTDRAMSQAHAFNAAELCLIAQQAAVRLIPEREPRP